MYIKNVALNLIFRAKCQPNNFKLGTEGGLVIAFWVFSTTIMLCGVGSGHDDLEGQGSCFSRLFLSFLNPLFDNAVSKQNIELSDLIDVRHSIRNLVKS